MLVKRMTLKKYKRLMLSNIQYFEYTPEKVLQLILGTNGSGKAQPLSSRIKVPGGWTTMGKVSVGDVVTAKDGSTTTINGVYPQGTQPIYRMTFADGRSCRVTGDHLWKIYLGGGKVPNQERIATTEEVDKHLNSWRGHLVWVDLAEPERSADVVLPMDPYVLGVILGDGCIRGVTPVITHPDDAIMERVKNRLGDGLDVNIRQCGNANQCLTYSIVATEDSPHRGRLNRPLNAATLALREFGLDRSRSHDKFVPEVYLTASAEQRLELLKGLMDTDGYVDVKGTCNYSTTSHTLAGHVVYLVRSLGGIAKMSTKLPTYTHNGERRQGRTAYQVNIRYPRPSELFTLQRKRARANDDNQYAKTLKLRVLSIELDGEESAQCISIDHPERLYITDDFIVTHNSSLKSELTPWPGNHNDFAKGGQKVFECEHRNHQYYLESKFDRGTGHHTFIKDGEVINDNGTLQMQKDLVMQEFGLTREILDLLLDETPFTDLSTAKRREWLTRLTPVDMSYAFSLFHKVKSAHRDQQGVIKHQTARMAKENHDLPNDGVMQRQRTRVKELTDHLNTLLEYRKANVDSPYPEMTDLQNALDDLTSRSKKLLGQPVPLPAELNVRSFEELTALITATRETIGSENAVYQRIAEEHQQLVEQAGKYQDEALSPEQVQELRDRVNALTAREDAERDKLAQYHPRFPIIDLPMDRRPREMLDHVFEQWTHLIRTIPANEDGRFSRERGTAAKEKYREMQNHRQHLDNKRVSNLQQLSRWKECESVVCPKCDHSFKPGVDPHHVAELQRRVDEGHAAIEALDKKLAECADYIEAFDDYMGYVRTFRRLTQETPLFQPVWNQVIEERLMFRSPTNALDDVLTWYDCMTLQITMNEIRQEREMVQHRLRYVEAIDKESLTRSDERRKQLEEDVAQRADHIRQLQADLRHLVHAEEQMRLRCNKTEQLIDDYGRLVRLFAQQEEATFQSALSESMRDAQMELAQTQEQLSRYELREGILNDLQEQYDQAVSAQKEYALLAKALAPTDGLIGRYLMGFMQQVVKLLNAIIDRVWTYPLEVLPSKVEKDELDYKFPLDVRNGAISPPDIAKGSSAQKDIVNFAFKLLVMKYLKLEDMPLYLDELGNMFDEQHRINTVAFIDSMVEMGHVEQVFYISHHAMTHGALSTAEVCVLDDSNITVPEKYNDHVVMH